jgi:hypothetical protein
VEKRESSFEVELGKTPYCKNKPGIVVVYITVDIAT